MRYDNEDFDTINQGRTKRPFFVVEIEFASGDEVYITSHDSALTPGGATVHDGLVKNVSGTSQSINPQKANSTIGAISFELIDEAGALTTLFRTKLDASKGLRRKRCRVYMGFDDLTTFDDYVLIQTQLVEHVTFDGGTYKVQCMDVQRQMREEIFELKKTSLSQSLDEDATTITVYDTSEFERVDHGTSYSDAPSQKVGYAKIGKEDDFEIIRYTGKTATTFTGVTRGVLGTRPREWQFTGTSEENGVEVTEYIYLEMPAVKLAYAILTGNLNQQAGESLPDHWHLGIDSSYVRLTDFTLIGRDWYDQSDDTEGRIVRFQGLDKQDGKQFIEEQLYLYLGAFSPVHADGALGLKRMSGVLTDSAYTSKLDETNIISYSAVKHDMKAVSNRILIEWNWNDLRGSYTRKNVLIDSDSTTTHGESDLLRLKFRGLHGGVHSYSALKGHFDSLRDRYAGPPLRLSVSVLPSGNIIEVGDIVNVDLTQLRDFSGTSTLNRSFEVQRVSVDWVRGRVDLALFGSSQRAAPLPEDETGTTLPNSWYTGTGTNLETAFPAQTSESGGVVTITGDINLTGHTDLTNSSAIYYVDGDCIIDAGVTVTYNNNTQLRVKGFLTCNGTLNGKGNGLAGGVASTTTLGQVGFIGPALFAQNNTYVSSIAGFIQSDYNEASRTEAAPNSEMPMLDLRVQDSALAGLPTDLRGSSGSFGGSSYQQSPYSFKEYGGNGGDGGAGLAVVCRGMSMGANGAIDCSGDDGSAGNSWVYSGLTIWSGGGAGGAPGGVLIALDGITANVPDLYGKVTAVVGDTITSGSAVAPERWNNDPTPYPTGISAELNTTFRADKSGFDMGVGTYHAAARAYLITSDVTANPDPTGTADAVLSISLEEQINTPPSPAANLSTVLITVTPPSDSDYSYAHIDYRLQGDDGWFDIGPAEPQAFVVLGSDGNTYEFRARSVSVSGEMSTEGVTDTIELSHIDGALDDEDFLNALDITGLELFEQGNDTDFVGKDAKFVWRKSSLSEYVDMGSETPAFGLGQGATDLHFLDYEVKIFDGLTLRRTEYVFDPMFVYTFEKNLEDSIKLGGAAALRQFTISVVQRTRQNKVSRNPALLTVQNPAPTIPAIETAPGYNFFNATYSAPTDPDWIGIRVYMSESSGFSEDDTTLVMDGPDTTIMISGLDPATIYYYSYVPYDAFGAGTSSGELSFSTGNISAPDLDKTAPTDPSGLTLTTGIEDNKKYVKAWVKAEWTASTDNELLTGYYVEYWDDVDATKIQTFANVTEFRITDAVPGRTYSVRVQSIDWASNLSAWTSTETIVADGDTTPPANVTGLAVSSGLEKVIITYTAPADTDFAATKIYRGTSSGFIPGASNLITTFPGEVSQVQTFIDGDVTLGTAYYYKSTTIDISGNESAASTAVGPVTAEKIDDISITDYFTNGAVTEAILDDLSVTASKLAGSSVEASKIANLAVGTAAIQDAAISAVKIDAAAVTTAKIQDAAITNAKINDVDAVKITAGTIDAARIGAGSITSGKINVTQLDAISANLGTVTAGTIQGPTIQTSAANARVSLTSGNGVEIFNSSAQRTGHLATDGSGYLGLTNPIQWTSGGVVTVPGTLISGSLIGKTIQTASSGWRVELTTAGLKYWNGTTTNFNLDASGNLTLIGDIELNKTSYADTTAGIWFGNDSGTYKAYLGNSTNYLKWTGTGLDLAVEEIGTGTSIGSASVAFGNSASAGGSSAVAVGRSANASANNGIAIGNSASATGINTTSVGTGCNATSNYTSIFGYASSATANYAVGMGYDADATGSGALAVGHTCDASGAQSVAIGYIARATASNTVSIGYACDAQDANGVAIGYDALADATHSTAIGSQSDAGTGLNAYCTAVGNSAQATGANSTSIGQSSTATAQQATALGHAADATGTNSNAWGHASTAAYTRAIAIGNGVTAGAANEIAIGSSADDIQIDGDFTVSGSKSFKIPHPTKPDYWLHHSAYEGDIGGGNIYRRSISTVNNTASLNMPDWFEPLNKDIDIFIQADGHFGRAFAAVVGNEITITSDIDGDYKVLIFGTRQDGATDDFEAERPMYDSQIFERDYVRPEKEKLGARKMKAEERAVLEEQFKNEKGKTKIDDGRADKARRLAIRRGLN